MKKVVLTFGLIAGGLFSLMMVVSQAFHGQIGWDRAEILGYTTLVLGFLMVFFGIRSYRDNVSNGAISFGRAFKVGALIALVASACYVATWEVIYYTAAPDFADRYAEHQLSEMRAEGKSQPEIDKAMEDLAKFREMYKNPVINVAFTLLEALPIGLLIALVSAAALRRKGPTPAPL